MARRNTTKGLRYPLSRIEKDTSYITFNIVEKTPSRIADSLSDSGGDLVSGGSVYPYADDQVFVGGIKNILQTIMLPLPIGIQDNNQVDWSGSSMNALEQYGAVRALDAMNTSLSDYQGEGRSNLEALGAFINDLAGKGSDTLQQLGNAIQQPGISNPINAYLSAEILKVFNSNVSANSLLSRTTGQILNPHLELLFNGVNLRSFTFDFEFTPRSKEETRQVKRIINTFKRAMAAKSTATGPQGWFIRNPDVVEPKFMRGSKQHPFLFAMKTCAIKDVQVNYSAATPNAISQYYDGTPTKTTMQLSLQELTPIYAENYDNDYSDESLEMGVGY